MNTTRPSDRRVTNRAPATPTRDQTKVAARDRVDSEVRHLEGLNLTLHVLDVRPIDLVPSRDVSPAAIDP